MKVADWLVIAAILLGPVIAVQLTKFLDDRKEGRQRKIDIFKTLMATRGIALSFQHVEALNRIDLEFHSNHRDEKEVIEAWKAYLDLLADQNIPPDQWSVRRVDLLVDLLHKMAKTLDYEFDKTHIKNSSYYPRLYGDIEAFQQEMRNALRELMAGKRVIPIMVMNLPTPSSFQANTKET
jgi:Family of unknown function (DUF6680)